VIVVDRPKKDRQDDGNDKKDLLHVVIMQCKLIQELS
jgi:hypothetical protein